MSRYSCPACERPWLSFRQKLFLRAGTVLTCPDCHQQAQLSFLGSIIAHLICTASPIPAALVALLLIGGSGGGQTLASLLWLIVLTALAALIFSALIAYSLIPLVPHTEAVDTDSS